MMLTTITFLSAFVALSFADGPCVDRRDDCEGMKAFHCNSPAFDKWIRTWCAKTCNKCGGGPVKTTSRPSPPTPKTHPTNLPPITRPPIGVCGKPQIPNSRVIAGTTATRGSWPWQIIMKFNGRGMCGGSLISPTWVVTAAHCVSGKERQASSFKIGVGEHNRNMREGSEEDIPVSKIFSHPSYQRSTLNNDIAIIKLSRPVKFGKFVSPVCLPDNDVPVGTECYITGWGKTRHPGSMTHILQQAKLPVADSKVCHDLNRNTIPIPITKAMVCAGHGGATRKSGCHGDSGGPFVCRIGDRWELHGAVSHGSPTCEASKTYTVFARVTHFRSWIDRTMAVYGV